MQPTFITSVSDLFCLKPQPKVLPDKNENKRRKGQKRFGPTSNWRNWNSGSDSSWKFWWRCIKNVHQKSTRCRIEYTIASRSNAMWKTKWQQGMTFESICFSLAYRRKWARSLFYGKTAGTSYNTNWYIWGVDESTSTKRIRESHVTTRSVCWRCNSDVHDMFTDWTRIPT